MLKYVMIRRTIFPAVQAASRGSGDAGKDVKGTALR